MHKPTDPAKAEVRLRAASFRRYARGQGLDGDKAIAEHVGLDRATVYRLLRGEVPAGMRTIATVLVAFPDRRFEEFFEVTAPEPVTRKRAA